MTAPIMIAYPCPECAAGRAILPPKSEAADMVRCAGCGRQHGRLDAVQRHLADQARSEGAQRARDIYRVRLTQKNRGSTK